MPACQRACLYVHMQMPKNRRRKFHELYIAKNLSTIRFSENMGQNNGLILRVPLAFPHMYLEWVSLNISRKRNVSRNVIQVAEAHIFAQ